MTNLERGPFEEESERRYLPWWARAGRVPKSGGSR